MRIRTALRKWGSLFGVVIPGEEVSKEGLRENDKVEVVVSKALNIRELSGKYKLRDLQKLKDELREGRS